MIMLIYNIILFYITLIIFFDSASLFKLSERSELSKTIRESIDSTEEIQEQHEKMIHAKRRQPTDYVICGLDSFEDNYNECRHHRTKYTTKNIIDLGDPSLEELENIGKSDNERTTFLLLKQRKGSVTKNEISDNSISSRLTTKDDSFLEDISENDMSSETMAENTVSDDIATDNSMSDETKADKSISDNIKTEVLSMENKKHQTIQEVIKQKIRPKSAAERVTIKALVNINTHKMKAEYVKNIADWSKHSVCGNCWTITFTPSWPTRGHDMVYTTNVMWVDKIPEVQTISQDVYWYGRLTPDGAPSTSTMPAIVAH